MALQIFGQHWYICDSLLSDAPKLLPEPGCISDIHPREILQKMTKISIFDLRLKTINSRLPSHLTGVNDL